MKLQTLTKKVLPFAIAGCAVVSLPAVADEDRNEYDDQCEWIEEIFGCFQELGVVSVLKSL